MSKDFYSKSHLLNTAKKWKEQFPAIKNYSYSLSLKSSSFAEELRQKRNYYWLQTSIAQLENKAPMSEICDYWSKKTEEIVKQALEHLKIGTEDFQIFLMGKLASYELNLSSDIDIIFLSPNLTEGVTKKAQQLIKLLSEHQVFGFCYRIDCDLRPNGRFSPLVQSFEQFESYYSNYGQVWERVALIRFRPLIPTKESQKLEQFKKKFCFRKYIDTSLLEDIKEIRNKLHKSLIHESEHINLKLMPGGIRDIELYTHSLCVIHGGKLPKLQLLKLYDIWLELFNCGILTQDLLHHFTKIYWLLRKKENLSQMYFDQQTHQFPLSQINNSKDFFSTIEYNKKIISDLINITELEHIPIEAITQEELIKMGFSATTVKTYWQDIKAIDVANKNPKDRANRKKVLQNFLDIVSTKGIDKDLALQHIFNFFKSTKAKSGFYNLLLNYPQLIDELVYIFSTSQYYSQVINNRPELLDSFLLRITGEAPTDSEEFLEYLIEKKLISSIFYSNDFLKNLDVQSFNQSTSKLADKCVLDLLQFLCNKVAKSNIEILSLGKWGGSELGCLSDLDFLFLTPEEPNTDDHRIARRLITHLTNNHRGGSLYSIDLRLRPNGNAGPLIMSRNAFLSYIKEKAKAWEKQAYLRARNLSDPRFDHLVYRSILDSNLTTEDINELIHIKNKLLKTSDLDLINIKYNKGGLIDLEFCLQHFCLRHRPNSISSNSIQLVQQLHISEKLKSQFVQNYYYLRRIEQLRDLGLRYQKEELDRNSKSFKHIANLLKTDEEVLYQCIQQVLNENLYIIDSINNI